jgi:hypothetical protein
MRFAPWRMNAVWPAGLARAGNLHTNRGEKPWLLPARKVVIMSPLVMFGLSMFACIIAGRVSAPLVERWEMGELLSLAWWILSVLAVFGVIGIFLGHPGGFLVLFVWLLAAAYGFGVLLYGVGSDMDDPDKY